MEKAGTLRKREKTRSKVEKRNIRSDMYSLSFLNKRPELVIPLLDGSDDYPAMRYSYAIQGKICPIPVNNNSSSSSSTYGKRESDSVPALHKHDTIRITNPLAHIGHGGGGESNRFTASTTNSLSDIWDLIIQRVIIISDSRIGTRSHQGKGQSLPAAFSLIKEKRGPLDRSLFLPFLGSQENSSYAAGKGDNANNGNGSERSTIVTPKVGIEKSFRKGTTPTPRNLKKFPGWASVQTSKQQQQSQQKGGIYGDSSIAGSTAHATAHATISQAADKIRENQKGQFVEIYRRLVHIPVISNHERAGDRLRHSSEDTMSGSYLSAFAKRLFAKFDKNMNGFISLEEFKESLLEMNINVSEEDTLTLFNRFETRQKDGTIDWNEFLDFFHSHIVKDIITDWDVDGTDDVVRRSIIDILLEIRRCLAPIIQQMKSRGWRSVEEYLTRTAKGRRRSVVDSHSHSTALIDANNSTGLAEKENTNKLSDNCLFHHLNTAHAARNRALLNQLGVKVDIEDMKRVNRVFARNVTAFMAFLQGEESHRLDDIMTEAHKRVISGFENRVGVNSSGEYGNALNNNTILKLWSIICSQKSTLKYDEMVSIVEDILLKSLDTDSRRAKKMNTMTNSTPRSDGGDSLAKNQPNISSKESLKNITAASPSLEKSSSSMLAANEDDSDNADENHIWINENFHGIHAELVSRCVTDMITQSAWNKSEIDSSDVDPTSNSVIMHSNNVSYSAFEAYVRYGHVNAIETKLKYLLQLEMSIAGPKIYSLVHTYINQERTEMIILVHEPLSGDVTSISIKEDFSSLPSPYELEEMCKKKCIENNKSIDVWASGRRYVYTPLETPAEDLAIWNIITRLRIVRTASARAPNELFMAEDPRLVNQINLLMDAALDLPFFCTCSDISLYFEVDSEQLNQARNIKNGNIGTGLKPLVFSAIRKSKALHSYLVNIMADLNVILTSYNSGVRITMSWKELIAHLTDYRNPYVTAELKPRFLEPHEYVYKPHESTSAYDGEEDNDPLAVQQSSVVMDGGTHPTFDCTFAIKFRPPKLTACKLLSTEIHKMDINGELKFVILMVREAKRTSSDRALKAENESFRFLTIYDPRNATDYQCGVKQGCDLYRVLCGSEADDSQENSPWFNSPENQTLEKFMEMVSTAADNNMILLGPAITPRLILTVLNQRGRHVEVLGHCQMSISAVLSGSGVVKPSWNTLTYMEEDNNGKEMLISAGELHVEMGFRKLSEIKSEIQAEKARLIRRKEQRTPVGTPIMRPMLSRSSASAPPTSAAAAAAERTEKMTSDSTKEPSSVSENNFAVSKDSIKQSEIEAPLSSSSSSAAAAAAAAELEELNKALQIAQSKVDRSNQLEHDIKLSEARLKELEIVKKAQEDTILALQLQVQEQSVILENKEKALQEQESLTLALKEKEKEKVKEPVKPATVSQTTKSPRQSQKKLDKEISVSASASASANELKELAELRAYVELVKLENDRRAEIDSKKEKDMKKLASQLQKQKEAAAKEKAVLEEQLAKEIFEREKIVKTATAAAAGEKKKKQSDSMTTIGGGGGGAGGSGTAAVKELSSSTPITSKEKKAGHGKDRDRDRASRGGAAVDMSVSGNAYSSSSDTGTGTGTVSLPNTSTSATGGGANSITFNKNNTAPTRDLDFEHEQKQRSQTTEQDQHAHIHQVPAIPPVTTSMDWSTIPLPNGWESKKDENTGRYFYVDHVNKKTQWRHPLYVKNKN